MCRDAGTLGSQRGPCWWHGREDSDKQLRPDFVPQVAPRVQGWFLTVALALPGGLWGIHPAPKSWHECQASLLPGRVTANKALTFSGPDPTSVSCLDEGPAVAFHQGSAGPPLPKEAAGWGAWRPVRGGHPLGLRLFSVLRGGGGSLPGNMISHELPPVTPGLSHPVIWWAVIAGVFSDHFCAR